MKKILLLLLTMATMSAAAQKITSTSTTINVGKTGFRQPVTAVFEFKNKGLRKLKIEAVKLDCACTVVEYPQHDIGIGDKFQIKMTYDAKQLGHFDKQAAVISNGSKEPVYIRMQGVVLTEVQDFTGAYPIEMGDLRIDKADIEFDNVNKGDQPIEELHVYNNGTRVHYPNLLHLPAYLSANVQPSILAPGRVAKITLTLNSSKLHDFGLTQTSIYLAEEQGEKVNNDKAIEVSTVLLPAFIGMTDAQKEYAPKMQLSKDSIDIVFEGKSKKSDVIDITNTGRTMLNISSLQLFTGGLKVTLGKRDLQPGETTKMKVTAYREELLKLRTRPRVLMITNDPNKPKVVITIKAK